MPKMKQSELRQQDKLVLRSTRNNEVAKVVFPNGIQVGLGEPGFNKGIILRSADAPNDTTNKLYVSNDKLFYGDSEVGTGAGATPGGITNEVQFNQSNALTGSSDLVFIQHNADANGEPVSGSFGINISSPNTAFSFVNDFATTTFEKQLSDNEGGGEIIKYGTGTTAAGELYYLHTDGSWADADADAASSGADQLLGVALGTSPTTHGILLKGYVKIASTLVNGTAAIGKAVYVSTTAGEYDFTRPSGANDFVRIVGYCLDIDSSDILLYFSPDPTFVEIS